MKKTVMSILSILLLSFITVQICAQGVMRAKTPMVTPRPQNVNDSTVFDVVDKMPSFPGGNDAYFEYINKHIEYPEVAIQNNKEGLVLIKFIVERDSTISNVSVQKSVDPSLDNEAIRIVRSMPKWNPGLNNNKPVRVMYIAPVRFQLPKDSK